MELTQSNDSTAIIQYAGRRRIIYSLVVCLNTPAPGVISGTVGGILGSLLETVERARGEVVSSVLGSDELGSESGKGQDSGLHLGGVVDLVTIVYDLTKDLELEMDLEGPWL